MKKLSVIVPVYFNEESLPLLFRELQDVERQLVELSVEMELILVDDGSGDSSYSEMLKIKAQRPATRLVKLSRNFGAVHSSKTGYQFVTGDGFLVIAADLQDPPQLIVEMVRRWLDGSKFVMCVREKRGDPGSSRLFAKLYYRLLRAMVVSDYPDGGYDLALMDRVMLSHMQSSGKNINPNVFAFWLGFKPEVIPYERRKRRPWQVAVDLSQEAQVLPRHLARLLDRATAADFPDRARRLGREPGLCLLRGHQRTARPL